MTTDPNQALADYVHAQLLESFEKQPAATTDQIVKELLTQLEQSEHWEPAFIHLLVWARWYEPDYCVWSDQTTVTSAADRTITIMRLLKTFAELLADDVIDLGYSGGGDGYLGIILASRISDEQHDALLTLFDERDEQTRASVDAVLAPAFKALEAEMGIPSPDWKDRLLDRIADDKHDQAVNDILGVDDERFDGTAEEEEEDER